MEQNKKDELSELSLNFDALESEQSETDVSESELDAVIEADEIKKAESEVTEYTEPPPENPPEDTECGDETESEPAAEKPKKAPKKKKEKKPKKERRPKAPRVPPTPIEEPALPLLVSAIVFTISLFALITNKFIYQFSNELLAPVILQIVALVIPAYLAIMLGSSNKNTSAQLKEIGCKSIRADHVFFMIFAAMFTMCASLALTLMLGGATSAARGITLLGTFTAGVNEFTVSTPYLILTYVIIPAIAEEVLFRGLIFSRLEKISFPFAAFVSCVLSALYGFSLGGFIPALFVSLMAVTVLYTTGSLIACVIVHALVNLYKLFLEANISAYFISSLNNLLLIVTVAIALFLSALLFFSEGARIFRERSQSIADGNAKSAKKLVGIKRVLLDTRAMLAYTPSLVFTAICLASFIGAVVISLLTL